MNGLRTAARLKNGAVVGTNTIPRRHISDIAITRTGKVSRGALVTSDEAAIDILCSQLYALKEGDRLLEVIESERSSRTVKLNEI
jgi:hypothetical protein